MPRKREDYDETETFEAMPKRSVHHEQRKTEARQGASNQAEPISAVKRFLAIEDARRIDRIAKKAVAACEARPKREKLPEEYGVSLLPPILARNIYSRHFHDPADPKASLARFNDRVAEFIAGDPDRKTTSTAYLGDIIVIKTVYPQVAALIVESQPMSVEEIKEQQFRLLHGLTGSGSYSRAQVNRGGIPHVSFERFNDLQAANNFRDALVGQDITLFAQPVDINPPTKYNTPV